MQPAKQPLRIAPAAFVDVAHSTRNIVSSDNHWQSDVGVGMRVAVPGSGVLRIDIAHGLRDGRSALSIGWGR
jgi:outer membrane translocation and assembly module TamA